MNDAECKVKKLFQTTAELPPIFALAKNPKNETPEESFFYHIFIIFFLDGNS